MTLAFISKLKGKSKSNIMIINTLKIMPLWFGS